MKNRTVVAVTAVAIVAFLLGQGFAQEKPKEEPKGGGAMGMMPAWTQLAPEHKKLADTAGTWDVAAQMWMAPGAPPTEFKATAVRKSILGGKYVLEHFKCNFMGMPFEGILILGYDTIAKQYVTFWIDNMSPVPGYNRGVDKDGTLVTEGKEPIFNGTMVKNRSVIETKNADEVHFTNYHIGDDGAQRVHMKMVYKRKAAGDDEDVEDDEDKEDDDGGK